MYLKLKSVILKNFGPFGNAETLFNFSEGLSLVQASNGSGKSFLFLDSLSYAFYGKPYRDVKIAELTNRKNVKNSVVQVIFETDHEYRIVRGQSPAILEIYKNGEENPMESSSSKKLDQDEINKIIGIDHHLFKLIIAIATNYNKPFLSLSLPEKRSVMESIFSINIFGEMLAKSRKKLNQYKTDKTIYQNNVKNLESVILTLKKQISELETTIKEFDTKKEDELKSIQDKFISLESQSEEFSKTLSELKLKTSEESENVDYVSEQIRLDSEIKISTSKISDIKAQIKFLGKHEECPVCFNVLTPEHKEKELKNLNDNIEKLQKKISSNTKKLETVLEKIKEQKQNNLRNEKLKSDIQILENNLRNLERYRKDLESQKKSISERVLNIDLESIKTEYEAKINSYREMSKLYKETSNNLRDFEIVSKMLSEDGIKSYFFKRLIPILNNKINEQLDKFDFPVTVQFDELMNATIDKIGSSEKNISYMSFSEGEKKRIDIAILLSFINTMKTISNWNCNILVFDEILDGATDIEGLEKLLTSIKEMTIHDPTLCAYVISHRDLFLDLYSGVVRLQKEGDYSKIEV